MRAFDWRSFFDEHRIKYVERGANVSRGEINIRCPFCGSADPSHHMGLNLETGWWSCWRNRSQHSGKSPLRLIMKLLGVPYGQARELAGLGDDYVDPEGFDAMAARIMGRIKTDGPVPVAERRFLTLHEFEPITDRIRTRRHWNYLYSSRGFNETRNGIEDVDRLCRQYSLRAGTQSNGPFADRIILPYFFEQELVTWTGRALGHSTRRYRDLEVDLSLMAPKETLYNHDCINDGGKVLVVQEGPFDALKVDFYGRSLGMRSVALSTNSISEEQAFLLKHAEQSFDLILVAMDAKGDFGVVDSMRMKQQLGFIGKLKATTVPFGADDGGAMTPIQVRRWANQFINGA